LAKLVARLPGPLLLAFRHPAVLRDQIDENPQIRDDDQRYHPDRLGSAGDIVTTEEIAKDCDQQPEPQHENKNRKDVGEKVGESKAA
jgi:hypothetical protein